MMGKSYEREVELYRWLEETKGRTKDERFTALADRLRKSLWLVLHVANTPPRSWQEELILPSALADLEKGNTFNYCVAELERFSYEHLLLASALALKEKIDEIKAL